MANYQNLMAVINAVIKTNNRREITGQVLQNVLNTMVSSIGENMQLTGFATPTTNPGQPDQNIFYVAKQAGTYSHFNNITLDNGLSFLMWKNGQWSSETIGIPDLDWVRQNFVSIDFFRRIFRVLNSSNAEIFPNDTTSAIDNVEALVAFWSDYYVSALGRGSGGGGGGGGGGGDVTWEALADGTDNHQIALSHLTDALTGYATQTWVQNQNYATQTWVQSQNYVSQSWVNSNYISISYFDRLFRAYNGSTLVNHNDTSSTINNIKAMFGFWTDFYISALGGGGASSVDLRLAQLSDVNVAGVTNGQALVYDSTTQKWIPGTSGLDVTAMWTALGANTNDQINIAHLSTALSNYVTTSAISDMATKTWVNTQINGMATQTWVGQNYISIAYFDRLFRAYNGSTLVNHNDTSSTIDNIKAMFGFWTDFYLSAMGTGGSIGSSIYLSQLADVQLTSPTNGQVLVYDSTLGKWKNGAGGGGSGVTSLSALTDVQLTSPSNNQLLKYDSTSLKWVNTETKTINGQSIIGSGDINIGGGGGDYLPLSGGTVIGRTIFSKRGDAGGTADNGAALIIGGTMSQSHIEIDDNEIVAKASATTTANLYLNWDSGGVLLARDGNVCVGSEFPSHNYKFYVTGDAGMTGTLYVNDIRSNYNTTSGHEYGLLTLYPNNWGGVNNNEWAVGTDICDGVVRVSSTLYIYRGRTRYTNIDSYGGTMTGGLTLPKIRINRLHNSGSKDGGIYYYNGSTDYLLIGYGSANLWIGANETAGTHHTGSTYISAGGGVIYCSQIIGGTRTNLPMLTSYNYSDYALPLSGGTLTGRVVLNFDNDAEATNNNSGSLLIGTPSGNHLLFDGNEIIAANNNSAGTLYLQYNGGTINMGGTYTVAVNVTGNISATGSVTALSDARHKQVLSGVPMTVEQIAQMPTILFRWTDEKHDDKVYAGTLAQNWQNTLPQAIVRQDNEEGTLAFNYGVAALVSSIITARKVVDHEKRIRELERENKRLKELLKVA